MAKERTHAKQTAPTVTPTHGLSDRTLEHRADGFAARFAQPAALGPVAPTLNLEASPTPTSWRGVGDGSPLAAPARNLWERLTGVDGSAIRVHTNDTAAAVAARSDARAVAYGTHLAFAPGQYAPHTTAGRWLLGHELGHVLQQANGPLHEQFDHHHRRRRRRRPPSVWHEQGALAALLRHDSETGNLYLALDFELRQLVGAVEDGIRQRGLSEFSPGEGRRIGWFRERAAQARTLATQMQTREFSHARLYRFTEHALMLNHHVFRLYRFGHGVDPRDRPIHRRTREIRRLVTRLRDRPLIRAYTAAAARARDERAHERRIARAVRYLRRYRAVAGASPGMQAAVIAERLRDRMHLEQPDVVVVLARLHATDEAAYQRVLLRGYTLYILEGNGMDLEDVHVPNESPIIAALRERQRILREEPIEHQQAGVEGLLVVPGMLVGFVEGVFLQIWDNLVGIAHLAQFTYNLFDAEFRQRLRQQISEIAMALRELATEPDVQRDFARMWARAEVDFEREFVSMSPFEQGRFVGRIIGRVVLEIVLIPLAITWIAKAVGIPRLAGSFARWVATQMRRVVTSSRVARFAVNAIELARAAAHAVRIRLLRITQSLPFLNSRATRLMFRELSVAERQAAGLLPPPPRALLPATATEAAARQAMNRAAATERELSAALRANNVRRADRLLNRLMDETRAADFAAQAVRAERTGGIAPPAFTYRAPNAPVRPRRPVRERMQGMRDRLNQARHAQEARQATAQARQQAARAARHQRSIERLREGLRGRRAARGGSAAEGAAASRQAARTGAGHRQAARASGGSEGAVAGPLSRPGRRLASRVRRFAEEARRYIRPTSAPTPAGIISPPFRDPARATRHYLWLLERTPGREAAIFRHATTGELRVVQGDGDWVTGGVRGLGRDWHIVEHYHPELNPFVQLPSRQDYEGLLFQHGGISALTRDVSSQIRYRDPLTGAYYFTEFGYSPSLQGSHLGPYYARVLTRDHTPVTHHFHNLDELGDLMRGMAREGRDLPTPLRAAAGATPSGTIPGGATTARIPGFSAPRHGIAPRRPPGSPMPSIADWIDRMIARGHLPGDTRVFTRLRALHTTRRARMAQLDTLRDAERQIAAQMQRARTAPDGSRHALTNRQFIRLGRRAEALRDQRSALNSSILALDRQILQTEHEMGTGLFAFAHAWRTGIQPYRRLQGSIGGRQGHHLLEQRLAHALPGTNTRDMLAIDLLPAEHQPFTDEWRRLIPYDTDLRPRPLGVTTSTATAEHVLRAARQIYADYPLVLAALRHRWGRLIRQYNIQW